MKAALLGVIVGLILGVLGVWRVHDGKVKAWQAERAGFQSDLSRWRQQETQWLATLDTLTAQQDSSQRRLTVMRRNYQVAADSTRTALAEARRLLASGTMTPAQCTVALDRLAGSCQRSLDSADATFRQEQVDRRIADSTAGVWHRLYDSTATLLRRADTLIRTAPVGQRKFLGLFGPLRKTLGAGCVYGVDPTALLSGKPAALGWRCGVSGGLSVSF